MNTETKNKIKIETCSACGGHIRKYWHSLTIGLAKTLNLFAYAATINGNKVHIRHDLELTITENNNFQKLRYFGLIAKYKRNGEHIAGYWSLTERGRQFLLNEKGVPERVQTLNNRIIAWSEHFITFQDVSETPYFEELGHFLETSESTSKYQQISLMGGGIA